MKKISRLAEDSTAYRDMIGQLLPKGPIWRHLAQRALGAVMGALGMEAVRFHNRMYELTLEAFPATADETLDEWEKTYGLPLCSDAPTTEDARRAALAGRVAAVGGASVDYFLDLVWAVLESDGYSRAAAPDYVTIEERPDGEPFRVSENRVGDRLNAATSMFSWVLHLPADASEDTAHVIECLVDKFKPAHTVVTYEYDRYPPVTHYYSSPGASGDYADAATNVAARVVFGGATPPTCSVLCFVRNMVGTNWMAARDVDSAPYVAFINSGEVDLDLTDSLSASGSTYNTNANPSDSEWVLSAWVADGSELRLYANGLEDGPPIDISGMTFSASNLFSALVDNQGGQICQPAILSRAVTADELIAIAASGSSDDIRHTLGTTGLQVLWRDADTAGAVANVGAGGSCNLTLHGAVTSASL